MRLSSHRECLRAVVKVEPGDSIRANYVPSDSRRLHHVTGRHAPTVGRRQQIRPADIRKQQRPATAGLHRRH